MRMTHPDLPYAAPAVVPDDPACIEVHRQAGWVEVHEDVQSHPGLMPGETPPEPEPPQAKPKGSKTTSQPEPEGDAA